MIDKKELYQEFEDRKLHADHSQHVIGTYYNLNTSQWRMFKR